MDDFQPEIYFTEFGLLEEPIAKDNTQNNREEIKIVFSIQNSGKGCYSIQAKLYEGQALDFFTGKKESYTKGTIKFEKYFTCDFIFEKQQNIEIILKKDNKEIRISTTLGGIVGSRNSTVIYKYAGDESLIIKAEKLGKYKDLLDVKLVLKENNQRKNYLINNKMYYFITCNNEKVYKSSLISNDGTFENIYIPTCILQPIYTVSLYNSQKQLIFSFNRTTKEIASKQNTKIKIPNTFVYLEDKSEIIKNFSFIDYINAGVKIALTIGIDFTRSNGDPFKYDSLHSIVRGGLNDYEKAILSCGNIVGFYDYDQLFPVFGFGAIINSLHNNITSNCFNLNMSDNPDIKTIDNVLKTYRDCLVNKKLTFFGPTFFAPLIREVIKRINKKDLFEYHILMILTDGIIKDLQPTIDALVEGSEYPLSVIIIGIGNEPNFKKMEILDGDEVPLISSKGKKWKRDLVQFVPFSRYKNDPKKLAMEVLAEIPRQIVEYYRYKNLNPIKIKEEISKNKNIPKYFEIHHNFVSNDEYFPNPNIKVTKNTISNSNNTQNVTNFNYNYNQNLSTENNTNYNQNEQFSNHISDSQNMQSINNSYYNQDTQLENNINPINNQNNQISNNSNSYQNPNIQLRNNPISTTHRVIQRIRHNNYNQNNQNINNNNSLNPNNGFNSSRQYNNNQGYSHRGHIYSISNNIESHMNFNRYIRPNTSGSQTQRNNSQNTSMVNPIYRNSNNNNSYMQGYDGNNPNSMINVNNFNSSNNVINIYNTGSMVNNFNDGSYVNFNNINNSPSNEDEIDLSKISLSETINLPKK